MNNILVPNQIISTRVNASSIEHYKQKGYQVSMNKSCEIRAEDLSFSSDKKVIVICDYCGKEFVKSFGKYHKQRKILQKDACFDCFKIKRKEVCRLKYNVDSTLQLSEVKEKSKASILERYGVENCMQSEEVRNNFKDTMMNRYGCEYAQQSELIRSKTVNTLMERYGVENSFYINKEDKYLYVNSKKVSKNQLKLSEYFNGLLNINIGGYFVDILLKDNNIIIEYNGGGHSLAVMLNTISQEEFDNKENIRINKLINENYKCLIIKNPKEKSISKKILKDITQLLSNIKLSNESIFYYNIV